MLLLYEYSLAFHVKKNDLNQEKRPHWRGNAGLMVADVTLLNTLKPLYTYFWLAWISKIKPLIKAMGFRGTGNSCLVKTGVNRFIKHPTPMKEAAY